MCDVDKLFSSILIDMPCKIKACVIKIENWYYILINSRLCNESQLKSYTHELAHIDLQHLDDYNYYLRNKNESDVLEYLDEA